GPVLLEIKPLRGIGFDSVLAQRVVVSAHRVGIALELAHHSSSMDVVHTYQAHPFRNYAKIYPVRFLPCVGSVTGPMKVEDHAITARPVRHGLNCRVA